MIVQVRQSQGQLKGMEEIISKLKKDKDAATSQARAVEKAFLEFTQKIRVTIMDLLTKW